jgi:hypothetical protein
MYPSRISGVSVAMRRQTKLNIYDERYTDTFTCAYSRCVLGSLENENLSVTHLLVEK